MKKTFIDTIVAEATPPGRGGIGIVRLSGPLAYSIATTVTHKKLKPRYAIFSSFLNQHNDLLDEGIVIYFPSPHSFTGEDVVEFQGHGSRMAIHSLIQYTLTLGARLARPGEFSERAFLNNKIDLTQAEAIADLIDASSEQAARSALRTLQGEFSKKIHQFKESLIKVRMHVESTIDFSDEDIDFLSDHKLTEDLLALTKQCEEIKKSAYQGVLLRDGITVVIVGEPNVGKSSLLNQLSGKDSAIVTDIPGTTRDVLHEYITLQGVPLHIVDTAGLRETTDIIEQEGIRRAWQAVEHADILIVMRDYSIQKAEKEMPEILNNKLPQRIKKIIIHNKIDLMAIEKKSDIKNNIAHIYLSAKTGKGVDLLRAQLISFAGASETIEQCFSARQRHLNAIDRAYDQLIHAQEHRLQGELLAEDLRQTQQVLCEITGEFLPDDLLGEIFSSFCIGK